MMASGDLALVLHAHLPFVRHPEHRYHLEENWLYEAITATYLPLLEVFRGLARDGVPFRVTMSMSPPLCTMLRDDLLKTRYARLPRPPAAPRRQGAPAHRGRSDVPPPRALLRRALRPA